MTIVPLKWRGSAVILRYGSLAAIAGLITPAGRRTDVTNLRAGGVMQACRQLTVSRVWQPFGTVGNDFPGRLHRGASAAGDSR